MNSSTILIKLNRVTRFLQMDKLLPRGSPCSLRTFSTPPPQPHLLARYSSSSLYSLSRTNYHYYSYSSLKQYSTSESTVEKNPKDAEEEAIKDQQREGFCKSACDRDPSNHSFDDILPHILNLYASCATPRDFEIYSPDATFEDPLMRAQGIKQIKSAFYSPPKVIPISFTGPCHRIHDPSGLNVVFSESRIVEYSIKEEVISPGKEEILIDNKQYYKFLGKDINMISLIRLHLEDGKIVLHEDWWDKKPLWNRETVQLPLLGWIIEMSRRASMLATHALMGFGKDPTV